MRLLIVTQAVDLDDPVLGFFHRWIEEFAKHCKSIIVICLKEGRHDLPENVSVHSLGKERGVSRLKYLFNFYRFIWTLRHEYDVIFVHMNQEYVLLGWKLWWLMRKRIYLWRNHYAGSWLTSLAVFFCAKVFCTSKHSYTARFKKMMLMPIGIDTELFSPGEVPPDPRSVLFLGRIDSSKRVDLFVRALKILHEEHTPFKATIVGDPSPSSSNYAQELRNLAASLSFEGMLEMRPGVPHEKVPELFRSHAIYCNVSPQGMFDKTIGEAMACGLLVVCSNDAVRGIVPESLMSGDSPGSTAHALRLVLEMGMRERMLLASKNCAYVQEKHSLKILAQAIMHQLSV